jgi:acyl carrier protein
MIVPPTSDAHATLRADLAALMRKIARRDDAVPFEPADATPCIGAELLGDSLDVLEFVVALDRDFGVSIRDSAVGREALRDLGTLTRFVADRRK